MYLHAIYSMMAQIIVLGELLDLDRNNFWVFSQEAEHPVCLDTDVNVLFPTKVTL